MHRNRDYPAPSKKRVNMHLAYMLWKTLLKLEVVKAGEVNTDAKGNVVGKESKVKTAYGQTKGLLWYNYIK